MASVRFGKRRIQLPASRLFRLGVGGVFVLGGTIGFLPVLGFWMVPMGFLILSVDIPIVRRWNRRVTVWGMRRWYDYRGRSKSSASV